MPQYVVSIVGTVAKDCMQFFLGFCSGGGVIFVVLELRVARHRAGLEDALFSDKI